MFKLNQIHCVSWPCFFFVLCFSSFLTCSFLPEKSYGPLRPAGTFTSAIQVLPLCICRLCLCHFLIHAFRNSGTINKSVWVVEDLMLLLSLSHSVGREDVSQPVCTGLWSCWQLSCTHESKTAPGPSRTGDASSRWLSCLFWGNSYATITTPLPMSWSSPAESTVTFFHVLLTYCWTELCL